MGFPTTFSPERIRAALLLIALLHCVAASKTWRQCGGDWCRRDALAKDELRLRIDVNRADWTELSLLPRIGKTLARRIVDSRRRQGAYRTATDLLRVRGIGPKTLERIEPLLVFRQGSKLSKTTDRTLRSERPGDIFP